MVTGVDFVSVPTRDLEAGRRLLRRTSSASSRSVYMPDRGFAEFETGNLTLSIVNFEQMGMEHHVSRNAIALHVDDIAGRARRSCSRRG